jgi:hypothetical protein
MSQAQYTRSLLSRRMQAPPLAKYLCPICGFWMDNEPASANICPCCGVEFGYEDSGVSYEELRWEWMAAGMPWWSPVRHPPVGWNPVQQLRDADMITLASGTSQPPSEYSIGGRGGWPGVVSPILTGPFVADFEMVST